MAKGGSFIILKSKCVYIATSIALFYDVVTEIRKLSKKSEAVKTPHHLLKLLGFMELRGINFVNPTLQSLLSVQLLA